MKQRLQHIIQWFRNRISIRRHINYGRYVLRHKRFVYQEGRKLGLPRLMLIAHDYDKFFPDEWFPYARTFYKRDGSKQYAESVEFARAWMKHQHRNKHHWQWWIEVNVPDHNCAVPIQKYPCLVWDRGQAQTIVDREKFGVIVSELRDLPPYHTLHPDPMPDIYRRELLADWRGAGRAINGVDKTIDWYMSNRQKMILHPETRAWIEAQLNIPTEQRTFKPVDNPLKPIFDKLMNDALNSVRKP
jgi:hypothetical protein